MLKSFHSSDEIVSGCARLIFRTSSSLRHYIAYGQTGSTRLRHHFYRLSEMVLTLFFSLDNNCVSFRRGKPRLLFVKALNVISIHTKQTN